MIPYIILSIMFADSSYFESQSLSWLYKVVCWGYSQTNLDASDAKLPNIIPKWLTLLKICFIFMCDKKIIAKKYLQELFAVEA